MSQNPDSDLESGGVRGNTFQDGPSSGANQPPIGEPNCRDSSGPLVSIYSRIAEEDSKMAERWQKDADGILIFTGLFSAAVGALLAVTVVSLGSGSNSQNTSAFYLESIYRVLSDSGSSRAPLSATVTSSLLFSPPKYVVWVNSLWVLSLVISLTCAGLATLVQQWARRYVKFIERPRYSPHQRMRVRTFFSYGVVKFHVSWVIEALLLLIHISLFLFFAGLLVFLHAITHPLFGAVVWWMALSTIAYVCITLLPIFIPNSPYYTPLSSIVWVLYTGLSFLVYEVLSSPLFGTSRHFRAWRDHYYNRLVEGMGKTAEKTASQRSLEIDIRFMMSTLDVVVEDDALVEFFESIPGFFDSDRVNNIEERLLDEFRVRLSPTLDSFLNRTFSSDSVSESIKSSRLVVCLNATHAVLGPDRVSQILFDILNGRWQELLQSVEVAGLLRQWSKDTGDEFLHYVQRIVTQVVVDVRECDERWISLVVDEFGVPADVLQDKMGHGDSMLLCLLLYMIRQADESGSWMPWILSSLCQFDVCNTLPGLQHEFCTLWNKIVGDAWARRGGSAINILREIRHPYIQLHQGTGAAPTTFSARTNYFNPVLAQPQSYRFCNLASHRAHVTMTPQGPVTVPPTTADHIPPVPLSTAQRGDPPSPISRFPSSAGFPPRSSTHSLTHRRTYPSLSPSLPPIQMAQRASSVKAASIPESIRSTAVRGHTLDRRHSLVPTAISRHTPRRATLSASDSAANIVRPHEPTPHIYPNEREEITHSPGTASLSTLPLADTPSFTDSPSSIGPGVPSFSESGPIYSSPHPTDQIPPVYTPDARPPVRLTARSSLPLGSNGHPVILKDIVAPSSVPCNSEIPPTAKPIPQSILPTGGGATPQRNEEAATAVRLVPSMTISDSQSASSALLPLLYGDMIPAELQSLRSTFPSPITTVSQNPLPSSSIIAVHVTASIETLSTSDGTRDHCPPILMESKSSVPGAEIYQHDINKS